jgi:cytochrome c553
MIREWLMRPAIWGGALLALMLSQETQAQDIAAGKKKASTACAVCHGVDGIAKNPDAPNLAGNNAGYIDRQLKAFRGGQRQHEQMSLIAESLSDADIADLSAWYAAIKVTVTMPE